MTTSTTLIDSVSLTDFTPQMNEEETNQLRTCSEQLRELFVDLSGKKQT